MSVTVAADEQKELEQKLEENKKKQEEIDKKIKATRGDISKEKENQEAISEQIATTEDYIRDLLELIKGYDEEIDALEADIAELEGEIAIQEEKVAQKRAEIDENIVLYEQRIRALYLSGNDSVASIILGSSDFFDMLMKIELVKRVADYDNSLIESLLQMKSEYEQEQLELENDKAVLEETVEITDSKRKEVEKRKAEWDDELSELEDLYSESDVSLKKLEQLATGFENDKDKLEADEKAIDKQIKELIEKNARKEYMGDLEAGTFLWPAPGNYSISSHYGDTSGRGSGHKGMDIRAGKGSDITAANSGVVIKVSNSCTHNYGKSGSCGCGGGYGNYCIIDHGGGYTTVYAHATEITVKEGQSVSTGDVIGKVGSTGESTGYHLHFEVRVNGERKNPESFNLLKY